MDMAEVQKNKAKQMKEKEYPKEPGGFLSDNNRNNNTKRKKRNKEEGYEEGVIYFLDFNVLSTAQSHLGRTSGRRRRSCHNNNNDDDDDDMIMN